MFTCFLLVLTGCGKFFVDGVNDDPNNFTRPDLISLTNHCMLNVAGIAESNATRVAALGVNQLLYYDRSVRPGFFTNSNTTDELWEDIYVNGIASTQELKSRAKRDGRSTLEGIALILEAYYFGEATLIFGDIPFSEANKVGISHPRYENQLEVLEGVIDLLNEGILKAQGTSATGSVFNTSSTWDQVGNALKARYLLALQDYEAALSAAQEANFISKANTWEIHHFDQDGAKNLFYQFQVEQRQDYIFFADGYYGDSYLFQLLNPSSSVYKGNSRTDESGRYAFYVASDNENINTSPGGFAGASSNFPVASFEEVQLIIAECQLILGENDLALAALNAVRQNNVLRFGTAYDDYLLSDFQVGGELYDGSAVESSLHMEIAKEKYCSVFGLATFQDVRRRNNMLGLPIYPSVFSQLPERFPYPETEEMNNNFIGLVTCDIPTRVNE
jgi:hypothetical protein